MRCKFIDVIVKIAYVLPMDYTKMYRRKGERLSAIKIQSCAGHAGV